MESPIQIRINIHIKNNNTYKYKYNRRWEPVWRVLEAENRWIREGNARRREQDEGRQPTADGLESERNIWGKPAAS